MLYVHTLELETVAYCLCAVPKKAAKETKKLRRENVTGIPPFWYLYLNWPSQAVFVASEEKWAFLEHSSSDIF